MFISDTQTALRALEQDTALREEKNFTGRADAIDYLDFHVIDRIEGITPQEQAVKRRAEDIKHSLEKIDADLFVRLRKNIGASFNDTVRIYLGDYRAEPDSIGYDNLDLFVNGLLFDRSIPAATVASEPDMVFYQKTPARIVFELSRLARFSPDDVFFDIGSGLGQVVILAHLISGVTAKGIEYEPAYCQYARTCAAALHLDGLEFINGYAHEADYSRGTVFFMYTPFEGNMLQEMLDILQHEARVRTIRLFTYGPCSTRVAGQRWLRCVNGDGDNPYRLYEWRSGLL
jgi:hypothetical protein